MKATRRLTSLLPLFLFADVLCAALAGGLGPVRPDSAAGCPFDFQQGMPPGVFCVYDGVATRPDGEPCGDRVIVMWNRLAPEFSTDGPLGGNTSDGSAVYFGFVTFPDLVLRAAADDRVDGGATLVDYTIGDDQPRVRLPGTAMMRFVAAAGGGGTEVLGLRIRRPVLAPDTCPFTAYDGTFAGVMTLPPDTPGSR